jgi:hypothetical protein
VRLLGGARDDEASAVLVEPDGAVLVGGYEDGDNAFSRTTPGGEARGVIRRVARDGRDAVLVTLDAPGPDAVDLLARGPEGGVHFAGRTWGALGGDPVAPGFFDVVGGRIEDGAIVSPFRTGVRADDRPTRLAVDDGGDAVIAGYAETEIDGRVVVRWEDGFVARVMDGEIARVDARSDPPDLVLALAVDGDAIVIGGVVQSGAARGPFVSRLDASLSPVWSTRVSTLSMDAITALTFDDAGDVVAVGAGTVSGETGQDVVVYRLTRDTGALETLATFGGPDGDFPTDAVRTDDGGLVIVGETLGGFRRPVVGDIDAFVLWVDASNVLERVEELGSPGDDRATAVTLDPCGTVIVAGYASGAIGDVEGYGRRDAMLVALGAE